MNNITEMLKGVLEGCVLEIINRKPSYGYEITQRLHQIGFEDVVEGTVYTILIRLEKSDSVFIEKQSSEKGPPRKLYSLNEKGHNELSDFWKKWDFVSSKISDIRR